LKESEVGTELERFPKSFPLRCCLKALLRTLQQWLDLFPGIRRTSIGRKR
jgi:hypothetical protein